MKTIINNIKNDIHVKRHLSYGDLNMILGSSSIEFFNAFKDIIYPHVYESMHADAVDFQFYIIESTNVYAALDTYTSDKPSEQLVITYCSNESGTSRVHKWNTEEGFCVKTIKTPSYCIADDKNNAYYVIVKQGYLNDPKWYKDIFSYFEHIVNKIYNNKGSLLFHAAAVVKDNKCYLLAGEKRAGKTTLFFELCKKFGCTPLSVDKVHIVLKNGELTIIGFPSRLRALAGTLSKYSPAFDHLIPEDILNYSEELLWKGESKGKVAIGIKDFENFVESDFLKSAVLGGIIFPEIQMNIDIGSFKKLAKQVCVEKIKNSSYTPTNPEEDWWSDIGKENINQLSVNESQILNALTEYDLYELKGSKNLEHLLVDFFEIEKSLNN